MSAYTGDELDQAVDQIGPSAPTYKHTPTGPPDKVQSFEQLQEIVAWAFLTTPDIIWSFGGTAVRKLRKQITTFLAHTSALSGYLQDMGNVPTTIRNTAHLDRAADSAAELNRALSNEGGSVRAMDGMNQSVRRYLDEELAQSSRLGGAIRTPRDEATDPAVSTFEAMGDMYPSMLSLAQHIEGIGSDWASTNLKSVAGPKLMVKIEARLRAMAEDPNGRHRSHTLELLSATAGVTTLMQPANPGAIRPVLGPGTGAASTGVAAGTGTPATITGTKSAPFSLPDPAELIFGLNANVAVGLALPSWSTATATSQEITGSVELTGMSFASISTEDYQPGGEPNPPQGGAGNTGEEGWDFWLYDSYDPQPTENILSFDATGIVSVEDQPAGNPVNGLLTGFPYAQPGDIIYTNAPQQQGAQAARIGFWLQVYSAGVVPAVYLNLDPPDQVWIEPGHTLVTDSPYVIFTDPRFSVTVGDKTYTVLTDLDVLTGGQDLGGAPAYVLGLDGKAGRLRNTQIRDSLQAVLGDVVVVSIYGGNAGLETHLKITVRDGRRPENSSVTISAVGSRVGGPANGNGAWAIAGADRPYTPEADGGTYPERHSSPNILGFTPNSPSATTTRTVQGTAGNNHLVVEVDGVVLKSPVVGGPDTPLSIGTGNQTLAQIAATLNGTAAFNAVAEAGVASNRLELKPKASGTGHTVRVLSSIMDPGSYYSAATTITLATDAFGTTTAVCAAGPTLMTSGLTDGHFIVLTGTSHILLVTKVLSQLSCEVDSGVGDNAVPDGVYANGFALHADLTTTCNEALGFPLDSFERGGLVTIDQIKVAVDASLEASHQGAVVERHQVERTAADVVLSSVGALVAGGDISSAQVGDTVTLGGEVDSTFHVSQLDPLQLTPSFTSDQLPASGQTYTIPARFFFDPLTITSSDNTALSAVSIGAGSANSYLGFVDNSTARGTVNGWKENTALDGNFIKSGVTPTDLVSITTPAQTLIVASVTDALNLVLTTEIVNNLTSAYTISGRGLTQFNSIAENSASPLPDWTSNTLLTNLYGFHTDLSELSVALAGAVQFDDLQRRRSITLTTDLQSLWSGLQTVLAGFNPPTLIAAEDILDTLSEWGLGRAVTLLMEARFSEFFSATNRTITEAGNVVNSVVEMRNEDFPMTNDPAILDLTTSTAVVTESEDPDYTYDTPELGTIVGYEAEDAEDTY